MDRGFENPDRRIKIDRRSRDLVITLFRWRAARRPTPSKAVIKNLTRQVIFTILIWQTGQKWLIRFLFPVFSRFTLAPQRGQMDF
jgi:hypothetical protein